jgi:hypothetical protein
MTEADDLDGWLRELCGALELPVQLAENRQLLLDVARDAAHGVMRPAAPLTTFLVGYAAGRATANDSGDLHEAVEHAAATATALALARISQADET